MRGRQRNSRCGRHSGLGLLRGFMCSCADGETRDDPRERDASGLG